MIAVDEALRRLEISAPERNAILEAFRYADARNAAAMPTAVAAAQQQAADAAEAADGHQQAAAPALTSKPFTRCATPACNQPIGGHCRGLQGGCFDTLLMQRSRKLRAPGSVKDVVV